MFQKRFWYNVERWGAYYTGIHLPSDNFLIAGKLSIFMPEYIAPLAPLGSSLQ